MHATMATRHTPLAANIDFGTIKVGGITPLTADAFPGKLAAEVFVQGCPWHCGYCHNPHLQAKLPRSPLSWTKILGMLKKRTDLVEAVVFTGGEPTLDPALSDAIRDVRKLGFDVGLQCGGAYPDQLKAVLPLLDWVALDVKAPFDSYERVTGVASSGEQARACAQAILAHGTPHEFRTTVHPALISEEDILTLAQTLADMGVEHYTLQAFRAQGCRTKVLKSASFRNFPDTELVKRVAAYFPHFSYRAA